MGFSAFPVFFNFNVTEIYWQRHLVERVDSAKSLIVDRTHLVQVSGRLVLQKINFTWNKVALASVLFQEVKENLEFCEQILDIWRTAKATQQRLRNTARYPSKSYSWYCSPVILQNLCLILSELEWVLPGSGGFHAKSVSELLQDGLTFGSLKKILCNFIFKSFNMMNNQSKLIQVHPWQH